MKKTLAFTLSLLLALISPVCLTARAEEARPGPLIYVPDLTEIALYYNDGETMYEAFNPSGAEFTRTVSEMLLGFIIASERLSDGLTRVEDAIDSLFAGISCGKDGAPLYPNVGITPAAALPSPVNAPAPIKSENLTALFDAAGEKLDASRFYVFRYDWRLAPQTNAALLSAFVEEVCAACGGEKASLLSAGYGGITVGTYLSLYRNEAGKHVSRCVFLDSMMLGSTVIGDLMAGRFHRFIASDSITDDPFSILKPDDGTQNSALKYAITTYVSEDPNGVAARAIKNIVGNETYISLFSAAFLSLLSSILSDEGVYGSVAAGMRRIAKEAPGELYSAGLREYLRNIPGLWAAVPEESFDEAASFLFGSSIPAELSDTINGYREIRKNGAETLRAAVLHGVDVSVVAGYSRQMLPLTAGLADQSDGLVPTRLASFGAITPDTPDKANAVRYCRLTRHHHVSLDGKVDASGAFLPERTWLIKNHRHLDYADPTAGAFLAWLLTGSSLTVHTNPLYPQYQQRSLVSRDITPITSPDSPFDFYYGDIDGDKEITAADARSVLRFAVGLEFPTRLMTIAADVDNDEAITAADARLILRFAVGLETEFPVDLL